MANKTTKASKRKVSRGRPKHRRERESDHLIWFERARAMQEYTESLKQADQKALGLFEIVADQMKNQFRFNAFLSSLIILISIGIIILSLIVFFLVSSPSAGLQAFSSIGMPASIFALILILFRNPIMQGRHLLESVLKINIVFVSFIRRVQQSDLLLQSLLYEKDAVDLDRLYLLMQEFQGIVDQTQQELGDVDQP